MLCGGSPGPHRLQHAEALLRHAQPLPPLKRGKKRAFALFLTRFSGGGGGAPRQGCADGGGLAPWTSKIV